MGQKVNPIGIRLGISREHNSVWYAEKNKYQQLLLNDFAVREFLKKRLDSSFVSKIEIERRAMFRRVIKRAAQNCMRQGALGVKVRVSGRLGGAEIARAEWHKEGRVPLHTLKADIDYGLAEAKTTYGIIGVKVWICKGEVQKKKNKITE